MYVATTGMVALAWPLWWLMHQMHALTIFAGQAGFAALFALGYGSVPALMSELLPPDVRCTGTGIGHNVAIGIFGGTAPPVATYLVARRTTSCRPAT
jgi:MHS family proline/betaine transporter-like MFS transporter